MRKVRVFSPNDSSQLKISINEPLFCYGGMRVPGLFCKDGSIGTGFIAKKTDFLV